MHGNLDTPQNGGFRQKIHNLILTAKNAGARDVFLLRGATKTRLHFFVDSEPIQVEQAGLLGDSVLLSDSIDIWRQLKLEGEMMMFIVFPESDGGIEGVVEEV